MTPTSITDRRLHHRQGPPARGWRGEKGGSEDQAIGRSRGGLSTKIHMAVRGLGCPVRFILTAGQRGDAPQAGPLIDGLPAQAVMADTAYDADHLRQAIATKGALAVIPSSPSRTQKHPLDEHLYAQRHLVECCFSKLKQFRRVATRYEKTARNYLAVVTLAAIVLWLR
jgi:transposase